MHLSKEDVNPPTQKTHWVKSFKTTMIFRPECHGFHKSAFVMVIKGYNSITPLSFVLMSAGGFHIKFQAMV